MKTALKLRPSERTKTEAVLHIMEHSRAGGVIQLFIMDALGKSYKPKTATGHRPGESNLDVVTRLLGADSALGRTMAFDVIKGYADANVNVGAEGIAKAFADAGNGMINPLAWFRAAEDAKAALDAAIPDPAPAPKLAAWEQATYSLVVKAGRYGDALFDSDELSEDALRDEIALRIAKLKTGEGCTIYVTKASDADSDED